MEAKSAEENRGRFITYAVDFGFERAIKSGTFDCDYRWKEFARPTGRYLELRFSHSTASVSQVSDPVCQPRAVVFRENARLRTQAIFPFAELEKEMEVSGFPFSLHPWPSNARICAYWSTVCDFKYQVFLALTQLHEDATRDRQPG